PEGAETSYTLPWQASVADRADFAPQLQARLADQDAPFHELEERNATPESVYLNAMDPPTAPPTAPPPSSAHVVSGIRAPRMFASLREQGDMLRHSLPFYVSSWWRRGDLSWVMYLNAFVLLLVAGTSLFGQLPGPAGQVAQRLAGGNALQAGLLLPLFFMSFALLESIKSSIGIWWEKAQGSLEVLLYTPVDDPSLIWLAVLPGAGARFATAPAHRLLRVDRSVWRGVRPRALDGDGFGTHAPPPQLAAGSRDPPQRGRGRGGRDDRGGFCRRRRDGKRRRSLALLVRRARSRDRIANRSHPGRVDDRAGLVLALAINTGAALPIYWSLVFGSGRRLDRLREAWSNYWALFRSLVIPSCVVFGLVVFRLLASG